MLELARAQLQVFESSHGQFFWNFRTELEPRWDFMAATEKGWLPNSYDSTSLKQIADVCPRPYYELPSAAPSNPMTNRSNHGMVIVVSITILMIGFYLISKFFNRRNDYQKIGSNLSVDHETISADTLSEKSVRINPSYQMISTKIQLETNA